MNYYIGIDPGKKGCLTILNKETNECVFFDWPVDDDIATYFDKIGDYIENEVSFSNIHSACIERVAAMPKQGVSAMFSFGKNYGMWLSFLSIYHVPFKTVLPQAWQKGLVSKADGKDTKSQTMLVAKRLFPNAELHGPKGGALTGRADSLLIAYYASKG